MKKFEYRILNLSEVEARIKKMPIGESVSWLDIMNELGREGWEFTGTRATSRSFLLKREIPEMSNADFVVAAMKDTTKPIGKQ